MNLLLSISFRHIPLAFFLLVLVPVSSFSILFMFSMHICFRIVHRSFNCLTCEPFKFVFAIFRQQHDKQIVLSAYVSHLNLFPFRFRQQISFINATERKQKGKFDNMRRKNNNKELHFGHLRKKTTQKLHRKNAANGTNEN